MKAISLWQPYASAALRPDLKVNETRHWTPPPALIGQRIAIHAAQKVLSPAKTPPAAEALANASFGGDWRANLPFGAIIGSVVLVSCRCMAGGDGAEPEHLADLAFGDWAPGRFAWRLAEPIELGEPFAMKGGQGWFNFDLFKVPAADLFAEGDRS